jgi:hypothetical protein
MVGRLLATCGWLAWHAARPFRRGGDLDRIPPVPVGAVAVLLVVLAALPIVVPQLDAQPEDVVVQQIFDGTVTHPDGWVRLVGRVTPLAEPPTLDPGEFGLLIDAANPLRAIVLVADEPLEPRDLATLTGHLAPASVLVEEELPIEATVAGTPPQVVADRYVVLDAVPKPPRAVLWPLSIVPVLLAIGLVIGMRVGYPLFRPSAEVDVLASPLGVGERVPAAFGGRIGDTRYPLADPGGALLLVRRVPQGNLLTAQPLPDEGRPAPPPVTIGGSWTSGRIGYVHTVRETVPALVLRSELVDATFLFARRTERDRVAALVSVDR